MEILVFEDKHKDQVIELWKRVFGYAAPHNNPAAVIQKKLEVQRELFFVAVENGVVAGTIMGGYDGHRGWIYSLGVDNNLRRQGIGTRLMKHLENALAARGCPKMNLQVVGNNADAVKFYQSLGYATEDRISMGKISSK